VTIQDASAQFPEEDLPGTASAARADYPSTIEPESIDPDFPSTPGAPPDPGTAPDAPQPDAPSVEPPPPIEPVEPSPGAPDPDPTPDEPMPPTPDEPGPPGMKREAVANGEVPIEAQPYDDANPNPPTETFFGRSIN
jgi:hypothetical protein